MNGELVREWSQVASAAKNRNWTGVMPLLNEHPELVNAALRKGRSWFTLLHCAAANDAPEGFISDLIDAGAFRTVKDSAGQRPVDVASRMGFRGMVNLLEPEAQEHFDAESLTFIQELFHGLIRAAMLAYKVKDPLWLPQLSVLTELNDSAIWFPVPGMAGGFHFWMESRDGASALIAESWCRMCGGSGMRHRITPFEVILEEEGFV
jgi:hypothetical protein